MAETPEERLARLRREVESTWTPPGAGTPASPPTTTPQSVARPPIAEDAASSPTPGGGAATPSAPHAPVADPPPLAVPDRTSAPAPRPAPVVATPQAAAVVSATDPGGRDGGDGWSLADALGGGGSGRWIGIVLVVVGAYLLLALVLPAISLLGSVVMVVAGAWLSWAYFTHRMGSWVLYPGAVLLAIGVLRVIDDLLPGDIEGETAMGLGLGLLAIGYLRHQQAGGFGWQGIAGAAALAWGLIQLVLGLLPGSPGILDLVLPAILLGGGVLLLARSSRDRR